jgi:tRNA A37 N6-isopentenylltransferase MiaA
MSILEMKQEIKSEIDKIDDERLLEEIQRLLHRDDAEIPEWHKQILEERLKEYESGNVEMLDWEEVEKDI